MEDIFKGKTILVTGSTGFLGKVLLEKLLRSCPDIAEIIVLLRPSHVDASARLSQLCNDEVFDRIKSECPGAFQKLSVVSGDVTMDKLGLSTEDHNSLVKKVSFVFHCAASVRFEDNPRLIMEVNLIGVKNVLEVCKEIENLQALVHVSTAFSFCNQSVIAEKIYDEDEIDYRELMNCLSKMKTENIRKLCQKRPSIYHYSKAAAESFLSREAKQIPVIIVRPAIITAAWKEPYPGWIDNYNGPSGFIALSSKGILKTLLVKQGTRAELVPVDLVANTLIAAAYAMAKDWYSKDSIPVINCVCPAFNSVTWDEFVQLTIPMLYKYPSELIHRPPGGVVTSSPVIHALCILLLHYLPAFIIDCFTLVIKGETRLVRTYDKIHGVLKHLLLYTTQEFVFSSPNMTALIDKMSQEDRIKFPIDQNSIDWAEYIEVYVLGVRKYILKENENSLLCAQRRLRRVQLVWFSAKMIPIGIVLFSLIRRNRLAFGTLFSSLYRFVLK